MYIIKKIINPRKIEALKRCCDYNNADKQIRLFLQQNKEYYLHKLYVIQFHKQ